MRPVRQFHGRLPAVEVGLAHPPLPEALRVELDKHRVEQGVSIAALACSTGFRPAHVTKVMQGRAAPSATCAHAIADALDVTGELRRRVLAGAAHGTGRDRTPAAAVGARP